GVMAAYGRDVLQHALSGLGNLRADTVSGEACDQGVQERFSSKLRMVSSCLSRKPSWSRLSSRQYRANASIGYSTVLPFARVSVDAATSTLTIVPGWPRSHRCVSSFTMIGSRPFFSAL